MATLTPPKHGWFRPRRALAHPALTTSVARRLHACADVKRAGFTLIELMTVVAIIGLLAMIAIPKLTSLKGRAQIAAMKSDLRNLVTAEENYFAQNLKYATPTDLAGAYTVSAGNSMPTITLTGDGWTATLTSVSTGQTCAVFMGSTPASPATKEGAPACTESGSVTVTP